MIVSCPGCGSRYNIPENRIGDSAKRFRCRKCSELFVIEAPKGEVPEPVSPPARGEDESQRAMRFARVLASDMLIYNRELVERARLEGTLQREMEQEILRSWELWKNRFPRESASEPELFRDALNHFLGDGEDLFSDWSPLL